MGNAGSEKIGVHCTICQIWHSSSHFPSLAIDQAKRFENEEVQKANYKTIAAKRRMRTNKQQEKQINILDVGANELQVCPGNMGPERNETKKDH